MKTRLQALFAVLLVIVFATAMLAGPSGCCSHGTELKATTHALSVDVPIFVEHSQPAPCAVATCCKDGKVNVAKYGELAERLKKNSARLAAEAAK